MKKILEIACFNIESAILAEAEGADRIELCENYEVGGITPSENLIIESREKIKIPIHVIIRPRSGNFIYSVGEIDTMKQSILFCKQHKINGVVFGALTSENKIDGKICSELIQLAKPMSVTFHRAIDECKDLNASFQTLIDLKVDKVLSSGGYSNAIQGLENLRSLQKQFGQQITIIPAGNVRYSNIKELKTTGCSEFHSSALLSQENIADKTEIKNLIYLLNTV